MEKIIHTDEANKTYSIMITNDEFDSETVLTKLTANEADNFIHSQCEWTDGLCWTIEASNPYLKNCSLVSGTGMFTVHLIEVIPVLSVVGVDRYAETRVF